MVVAAFTFFCQDIKTISKKLIFQIQKKSLGAILNNNQILEQQLIFQKKNELA